MDFPGNIREFKAQKRREFKLLGRFIGISGIQHSCIYLPPEQYEKLTKGIGLIFEAQEELRPWWKNA